jgi:hypothetical protein
MTDLAQAPAITVHHPPVSRPRSHRLGIGNTFSALCALLGEAYAMAYVEPFLGCPSHSRHKTGEELNIGS